MERTKKKVNVSIPYFTLWQRITILFKIVCWMFVFICFQYSISSPWTIGIDPVTTTTPTPYTQQQQQQQPLIAGPSLKTLCSIQQGGRAIVISRNNITIDPIHIIECQVSSWSITGDLEKDNISCVFFMYLGIWPGVLAIMLSLVSITYPCLSKKPRGNKWIVRTSGLLLALCSLAPYIWMTSCEHSWIDYNRQTLASYKALIHGTTLPMNHDMNNTNNNTTDFTDKLIQYADQTVCTEYRRTASWYIVAIVMPIYALWLIIQRPKCPSRFPTQICRLC